MTTEPTSKPAGRSLDLESLKALAHPLRVRILDTLSTYGPFTASGLAERLGESSGATSYHLRQLEKHGFVREVAGRGTGRERWWERMPGGIQISAAELHDTEAGRAASVTVMRQWEQHGSELLRDYLENGLERLSAPWLQNATLSSANLRLTVEQLQEVGEAWDEFSSRIVEKYRGLDLPGARPVRVDFHAFPVVDGEVSSPDSREARS